MFPQAIKRLTLTTARRVSSTSTSNPAIAQLEVERKFVPTPYLKSFLTSISDSKRLHLSNDCCSYLSKQLIVC